MLAQRVCGFASSHAIPDESASQMVTMEVYYVAKDAMPGNCLEQLLM